MSAHTAPVAGGRSSVKRGLTRRRPRRDRETMEYLGAARRFIRAAGRRVADADEPELAALVALRTEFDDAIAYAVAGQRARGRSWAFIGAGLGVTRQAAQDRYGGRS